MEKKEESEIQRYRVGIKRESFSFLVVHVSDLGGWIMWSSNCGRGWGCFEGRYAALTLTASHSYMEAAVDRWSVEDWEISLSRTHARMHTRPRVSIREHEMIMSDILR